MAFPGPELAWNEIRNGRPSDPRQSASICGQKNFKVNTSTENRPRVLLVAGGTGGHISPGLALAEAFVASGARPVFLTLGRNRSYPDFAAVDFPLYFYDAPPIRRAPLALLLFPWRFARAVLRAFVLIGRERIQAVIGLGGYPMAPAMLAALLRGRLVYLCEQNAVPGKVTRLFSSRARRLFLTIPLAGSVGSLAASEKLLVTGNPLRRRIVAAIQNKDAGAGAGDSPADPLAEGNIFGTLMKRAGKVRALRVLVVGGSQGALQLNEMVKAALPDLPDVVWVVQCGVNNLEGLERGLPAADFPGLHLLGFTRDIHALYRSADVLVCRAGAGVLTEAAGFGLPLVLVPYPFAADNHQQANAEIFRDGGAARLIARRDTDPAELIGHLKELGDEKTRKSMGRAARGLARLTAAQDIAERVGADIADLAADGAR